MSKSLQPEDLALLRQCAAVYGNTYARVLLHLLERVEALEARPIPGSVELAAPAGGLVERVAAAIHPAYPFLYRGEARAAIREVAAWLDLVGNKGSADKLRREADR
jgi:hypothetical protein